MLTRIVISEMDRRAGQRVQTCIGKQGVVLQMYLVSECICILVYNMQNVAMNRFCWGSLTLLNNPDCHSFDFSSAAQVIFSPRPSPTCDLSPKTGLKHHLDHQWPVHSLCRCALPQVRSCAHWAQACDCDANITSIWCKPIQWHIAGFSQSENNPLSTSDAFWLGVWAEGSSRQFF